ncbi:Rpn family recombination-promoting nuclease/putative transposase [Nocardia nova]|uniref:Rpn family recombination-promoting nuclease/putative transposase n=1 Tax=Nocardia nova TaxID=37330 RepID=UPI0033D777E3
MVSSRARDSTPNSAGAPAHPHDRYFRRILGRPADAASELRAVLPKSVVARVDWDSMELQSGSLLSKELASLCTDLLFRTRLDDGDAYIFILIEHQSSEDRFMALRTLEYTVNIWKRHLAEGGGAKTLPPVIPVVVYSCHEGLAWSAPTEVADLIDLDDDIREALTPYLPRCGFILDDIAAMDVHKLLAREEPTVSVTVMLTLHKIAFQNPDLYEQAEPLIPLLSRLRTIRPNGLDDLVTALRYVNGVSGLDRQSLQPLIDLLDPPTKEVAMTVADELRAEGEARGLLRLLTHKFGELPTSLVSTVHNASLDDLERWSLRILTADSLQEVFGR